EIPAALLALVTPLPPIGEDLKAPCPATLPPAVDPSLAGLMRNHLQAAALYHDCRDRQRRLAAAASEREARELERIERARKALEARADALLARARGGETLEAIAAAEGLAAPETHAGIRRGQPVPTPEASEAMFAVPAPAAGKRSFGRALLEDGRAVVFAVSAAQPGRLEELNPMERASLQQPMVEDAARREIEALLKALRTRMKVTVNEANL
ncbi:hypothetical protein ABTF38_14050, partial [Acinetobacter baumannii]